MRVGPAPVPAPVELGEHHGQHRARRPRAAGWWRSLQSRRRARGPGADHRLVRRQVAAPSPARRATSMSLGHRPGRPHRWRTATGPRSAERLEHVGEQRVAGQLATVQQAAVRAGDQACASGSLAEERVGGEREVARGSRAHRVAASRAAAPAGAISRPRGAGRTSSCATANAGHDPRRRHRAVARVHGHAAAVRRRRPHAVRRRAGPGPGPGRASRRCRRRPPARRPPATRRRTRRLRG